MKIVISDANLLPHRSLLESALPTAAVTSWHDRPDEKSLLRDLRDADVFVSPKFTRPIADAAQQLRLVHATGAGYDGIDLHSLPQGAVCANTFNHENSIAEYIAATLVALRRGILRQDAALRSGQWDSSVYKQAVPQPDTLRGGVAAFLGFGHIGKAAWNVLRPFGIDGIAITRSGNASADAHALRWTGTVDRLEEAVAESDFLVVSIPLTEETTGMIGRRELERLGGSGLLVNVARGPVVDEDALYRALRDRVIAAAAIDVWYQYPDSDGRGEPSTLPFNRLDNILMTPHVSGVTAETFRERALEIAANISRLERGEQLKNVVSHR